MNMQFLNNDTIAAIGTPLGEGGICVVRMSGPSSFAIADRIFTGRKRLSSCDTHTIHHGYIFDPQTGERVDEVLLSLFKAPRTYTCENLIEISGHGGIVPASMILQVLINSGARLAGPGEFTKRAFINGRIDLLQAEAVGELIRARTNACARASLRQLDGECSAQIEEIREKTIQIIALIEVTLDFTEEDLPDMDNTTFLKQLLPVQNSLVRLIKSSHEFRVLRDGLRVALIGKPNVGKSSILNRLVSKDRAIVHQESGTTRDTIEETVDIRGVPITFVDTAGIRKSSNTVEQQGITRSREELQKADIQLAVFDASTPPDKDDQSLIELLAEYSPISILNKCDLETYNTEAFSNLIGSGEIVKTSATIGVGIEELIDSVVNIGQYNPAMLETGLVANARQVELLKGARVSLEQGIKVLKEGSGAEIAAIDLRDCVQYLGGLLGKDIGDSILDRVFAQFCIGK